jgi:hypothetical protein
MLILLCIAIHALLHLFGGRGISQCLARSVDQRKSAKALHRHSVLLSAKCAGAQGAYNNCARAPASLVHNPVCRRMGNPVHGGLSILCTVRAAAVLFCLQCFDMTLLDLARHVFLQTLAHSVHGRARLACCNA